MAGELLDVTYPSPVTVTESATVDGGGGVPPENVAVTETELVPTSIEQSVPDELSQPDQLTPPPVVPGDAVSSSVVFGATLPWQVAGPGPQFTPAPETVPAPLTVISTGTSWAKVAVTVCMLVISTLQVGWVPLQSPPQPVKA
jgi:hypothetical protein